jgi:Holliday junction resolvase RusA-like endonuclease
VAKPKEGTEAPSSGELHLSFSIAPVSIQSKSERRAAQRRFIAAALSRYRFLVIGEVQVAVTWHSSEWSRYESCTTPDVDNIVKPLLDALVGPAGVLVDDCQMSTVVASYAATIGPESVAVRMTFDPTAVVPKEGLVFVELGGSLCAPVSPQLPREKLRRLVEAIEAMVRTGARPAAGGQEGLRIFHKHRVTGRFACEPWAGFKARSRLG